MGGFAVEVTKLPLAALMMHAGACSEALVWAGRKPLAEESLRDCPRYDWRSWMASALGVEVAAPWAAWLAAAAKYLSGSGDGDGSGYGSGYWQAVLDQHASAIAAKSRGATAIGYWRSNADGLPANYNGKHGLKPAAPGDMQEVAGPLEVASSRALHATLDPQKWKGERLWIVALYGDVVQGEDKMGALKREILAELPCRL